MIERLFASTEAIAKQWRTEAASRSRVWPGDPVAGILDYCAGELESHVTQLRRDTETITVAEYAKLRGKTQQTVRAWIKAGVLDAVKGPGGYEIPATARPRIRAYRAKVAA